MVRYADDMVILCQTREEAEAALARLRELLQARELVLHPTKTRIAHLNERPGFQFLGYVFYSDYRDPRPPSQLKLRTRIRKLTKRTNGNSLATIVKAINVVLRGWINYFQFCSENSWSWAAIDGYVRFRLRAILDKRRKVGRRRGRGRGHAHRRWPNRYFTELGLFSLERAPKLVLQP